jgi:hypothetical protein
VDTGGVRSLEDAVCTDGGAWRAAVLGVSRQRAVCGFIHGLRVVPSGKLQQHNQSQPCDGRISTGLQHMPQHGGMEAVCF